MIDEDLDKRITFRGDDLKGRLEARAQEAMREFREREGRDPLPWAAPAAGDEWDPSDEDLATLEAELE